MLSARERQERSAASLERQFVYRAPWAPRASRASGGGCGFADGIPVNSPHMSVLVFVEREGFHAG
jgi:hypothetical protein